MPALFSQIVILSLLLMIFYVIKKGLQLLPPIVLRFGAGLLLGVYGLNHKLHLKQGLVSHTGNIFFFF